MKFALYIIGALVMVPFAAVVIAVAWGALMDWLDEGPRFKSPEQKRFVDWLMGGL